MIKSVGWDIIYPLGIFERWTVHSRMESGGLWGRLKNNELKINGSVMSAKQKDCVRGGAMQY